jgi:hypothetical protein
MNDMSSVIIAKSDQVNADDLISGPMTITVRSVNVKPGTEQPVAIDYGDDKKVFRPCKTVARVLVAAWGPDSTKYVGRSMTLYRDPKVRWAGLEVGGIRVSHLSHIEAAMTIAVLETRQNKRPITVQPLKNTPRTVAGATLGPAALDGGLDPRATTTPPAQEKPAQPPESPPAGDVSVDLEMYGDEIEFVIDNATDASKLRTFWSDTIANPTWQLFKADHVDRAKALKKKAMDKIAALKPAEAG